MKFIVKLAFLILPFMLLFSYKSQAQQILSNLFNKEGVLYMQSKNTPLDLSKPIPIAEMNELSFGTEANVFVQYLQIDQVRKGNKIKEQLIEKSGSETITSIDMAGFELMAGDLFKLEVIRAIKINEKTGKVSVYKFKDPFFTFTIK